MLCLIAVIPSGSVLGEQLGSEGQKFGMHAEQDLVLGVEFKPQKWTVPCERDDGSQGIFLVSSKVPDVMSPQNLEQPAEVEEMPEAPPSLNMNNAASVEPEDDDPFGYPKLKCGKLLTLLSIFATTDSHPQ